MLAKWREVREQIAGASATERKKRRERSRAERKQRRRRLQERPRESSAPSSLSLPSILTASIDLEFLVMAAPLEMLNRKRQGAGSDRKRRPFFPPPFLSRDEKNPNTQIFRLLFSSSTASQKPQLTRQTPRPSCLSCTRSRPGSGPSASAWLRCSRVRREERVFFVK